MKIEIGGRFIRYRYMQSLSERLPQPIVYTVIDIKHADGRYKHSMNTYVMAKMSDGRVVRYDLNDFVEKFKPLVEANKIWKELNE